MNKWNLFLTTILTLSLIGCESVEKWDQDPAAAAPTDSGTTATTGSTTTTTTTTVNATLQELTLTVDNSLGKSFTLHKANDASAISGCTIDKDSLDTTPTDATLNTVDIDCYMEAEELDLYFNDLSFNIEVPSGVCEYTRFRPYWFWQYQPGNTTFTYQEVSNDTACTTATHCTSASPEVTTTYDSTTAGSYDPDTEYALFNHTRPTNSAPNCDEGTITLQSYSVTWSDANGDDINDDNAAECTCVQTDTVTQVGGNYNDCIAGPGKDFLTSSDGYPVGLIYYSNDGLSQSWNFEDPFTKGYSGNIYAANYSAKTNAHDSLEYGDASEEVDALDTVTEDGAITGTYRSRFSSHSRQSFISSNNVGPRTDSARAYYQWECLNKAYDVKGRIRVWVRDWDKEFPTTDSALLGLTIPHSNVDNAVCVAGATGCPIDADSDEMMDNTESTDMWGNPWDNKSDWDNFAIKRYGVECAADAVSGDTLTIGSYTFTLSNATPGYDFLGTSSTAGTIYNVDDAANDGTKPEVCNHLYTTLTNKTYLKYPVLRNFFATYDLHYSSTPTSGTWATEATVTINDADVLYVVPKYRSATNATDYNSSTDAVYHVTKASTKKPADSATTVITESGTSFEDIFVVEAPIYNEKEATGTDQHTGGRAYAFPRGSL